MNFKLFFCLPFVLFSFFGNAQTYASSGFTMISNINPETTTNQFGDRYSGCWGWYQAAKNKEYAIACSHRGIYWVDVTNPATPTVSAYQTGSRPNCTWREVKTYQNYCYVISDDPHPNSFQIFDMQYLPDSVHKVHEDDSIFERAHTLWQDGDKLYVSGVTYATGTLSTLNIYSLANPAKPALLRQLNQDYSFLNYVHDTYARNDTLYASAAYQGLHIFKYSAVTNTFTQLGSLTSYPGSGYNHSSALTPNGKTLVFLDEVPHGLPIKVADVTNPANVQVLATTSQFTMTTPHNPFIISNKYCFISAYQDGLQLYDISVPQTPVLAGYFDTYPQSGGNTGTWTATYDGQWGSYPFFPSGNIFALDQQNGIFMLKTHLLTSGITEDDDHPFTMIVYPDPANNTVHFNIPASLINKDFEVEIVDLGGKQVLRRTNEDLDPSMGYYKSVELMAERGIYFLKLSSQGSNISAKKFIIAD